MKVITLILFSLTAISVTAKEIGNLPGFENDIITGWRLVPGVESQLQIDEAKNEITLTPNKHPLGLLSNTLKVGEQILKNNTYNVQVDIKANKIGKGYFAFSMDCMNASGKRLKQLVFYALSPKSKVHDWKTIKRIFGPKSRLQIPEGTDHVIIKFTFSDPSKTYSENISIKNLKLTAQKAAIDSSWPKDIVATCEKLQVRFESRSFWTLYRVKYDNGLFGVDKYGSHYGSVANFKGIGFIGSGHTENEDEQLKKLELFVDGKKVDKPNTNYTCKNIELKKWSVIKTLKLYTDIKVKDNKIYEEVTVSAVKDTPVKLFYHFMHPWTEKATNYLAQPVSGQLLDDEFINDNGFRVNKRLKWSAVYDKNSQTGAVIINKRLPEDVHCFTKYWDHKERYKKHYLQTFSNQTIKAGKNYKFSIIVIPFKAAKDGWKATAKKLAQTK